MQSGKSPTLDAQFPDLMLFSSKLKIDKSFITFSIHSHLVDNEGFFLQRFNAPEYHLLMLPNKIKKRNLSGFNSCCFIKVKLANISFYSVQEQAVKSKYWS